MGWRSDAFPTPRWCALYDIGNMYNLTCYFRVIVFVICDMAAHTPVDVSYI
jgi:hypothetical protein